MAWEEQKCMPQDFYVMIVDESNAWINCHCIEIESNLIVLKNVPGKLLFCYSLSMEQKTVSRVANQITAFALVC